MIGVIVTLRSVDRDRAMGAAEKAAPTFEGMPGLRSKVFTWDAELNEATNVYVWESEEAARAFFSPEVRDLVVQLYGVEPEIRFVEIGALVENGAAVTA
jgi:heme-degrading monooxygenase HmoA